MVVAVLSGSTSSMLSSMILRTFLYLTLIPMDRESVPHVTLFQL
jgi:hypothetical protein